MNQPKRIYTPLKKKTILTMDDATSNVAAPNVDTTRAAQVEPGAQEKLEATFLTNAPETLAKLRASHQVFAKTEEEGQRGAKLSEMHLQVRALAGSNKLTGFRKIAQMTSALEALLVELHAKPQKITPSVMRTVAQAIDTLTSLFEKAVDPQPEVMTPPRILVVDDEIISRETICSALRKANLPAVNLDDSIAAQRLLEQDRFDLIFLDVEMPGQTGLELCAKIRKMPSNGATPVVFVTAHSDFGSRAQSTLSGGNDFIAKPFLLVELAIKAFIWLFKQSPKPLSIAQSNAPGEAAPTAIVGEEPVLEPEIIVS